MSNLQSFGDSFTVGFNASPQTLGYAKLLANLIGGTFNNYGVGSSMSTTSAKLGHQNIAVNRTKTVTWMAGLNDIRQAGLAAIPKLEGNLRAFLAGCFLTSICPASLMTRNGAWTALSNTYGGKSFYNGGTPLYCNSNMNAYLEWNFTGDNVVVGAYRTNGTTGYYRDLSITIDGGAPVIFALFGNTNEIVTFDAKVIKGLGSGAHTIRIKPTTTAAHTVVDFVGTLANNDNPVLVSEIPYLLNWAQYSSVATQAICDQANQSITNVLAEFSEFNIAKVLANTFYNPQTMCSSDGIHPTNAGHEALLNAFLNKINLTQKLDVPSWATKIVINDGTEHIYNLPLTIIAKN